VSNITSLSLDYVQVNVRGPIAEGFIAGTHYADLQMQFACLYARIANTCSVDVSGELYLSLVCFLQTKRNKQEEIILW